MKGGLCGILELALHGDPTLKGDLSFLNTKKGGENLHPLINKSIFAQLRSELLGVRRYRRNQCCPSGALGDLQFLSWYRRS